MFNHFLYSVEDGEDSIIVIEPCGAFDPVTGDLMLPGLHNITDLVLMSTNGLELLREPLDTLVDLTKYEARVQLPSTGMYMLIMLLFIYH